VVGHIHRRISSICSIFSVVKIIGEQMKFHQPNPLMFFTAKVLCYIVLPTGCALNSEGMILVFD